MIGMASFFADGFMSGLTMAPFCAAFCLTILLPVLLVRGERGAARNLLAVGEFIAGRLVSYLLFGLAMGYVGVRFGLSMPSWLGAIAYGAIGLAMVLAAAGLVSAESRFCALMSAAGRKPVFPLLLGALTGVSLCPPFVMALGEALKTGGPVQGMAYFSGFFLSTSLFVLPAAVGGFVSFLRVVRAVGTVACAVMGMALIMSAAHSLAPVPGASETPARAEPSALADRSTLYREVLPRATRFEPSGTEHGFVLGFRGEAGHEELVGMAFVSSEVAPESARGFGGAVPALVGINLDGRITGVRVLPNEETPGFIERVDHPRFLGQFEGKRADALAPGRGVDAVTGATVSSSAIINGVSAGARVVMRESGLASVKTPNALVPARGPNYSALALVLILAVAVAGSLCGIRWLRFVTLGVSVVLLGFLWKQFLSVQHLVNLFTGAIEWLGPHGESGASWSAARVLAGALHFLPLILAVSAAFFVGRVYCGWVCPFGALTELLGRVSPFRRPMPPRADALLRRLKYALLVAVPPIAVLAAWPGLLRVEPFTDVFVLRFLRPGLAPAVGVWLVVLAIFCLVFPRLFCKYICVVGAALGFVSSQRLLRRSAEIGCLGCSNCSAPCPTRPSDVAPGRLSSAECLACGACQDCARRSTSSRKERKRE